MRRSLCTPDAAAEGYRRFAALEIDTYSLGEREYQAALSLACARRVSVCDASYLVLAVTLDVPMVTADRRLAGRLGDEYSERLQVIDLPEE